jgi:CRP/FNR family transcriptional regulator, cyclic AMP receptor protein
MRVGFTTSFSPSVSPAGQKHDVRGLIQAVMTCKAMDSLQCAFGQADWQVMSGYLQPVQLAEGDVIIEQGSKDSTVYLIERGSVSVHYHDDRGELHLAIVSAGSVVGEGAFFSHMPRSASVHAASDCKLWALTAVRFTDLSARYPAVALQLTMGLGAVVSKRLGNFPKRIAIT